MSREGEVVSTTTRQVVVARHLGRGERIDDTSVEVREAPVRAPCPGEVLLDVHYLSIDPYLRGRLTDDQVPGFPPTIPVGGVIDGYGVGRVLASSADGFDAGDLVSGTMPWAERGVAAVDGGLNAAARLRHVSREITEPMHALGVQGLTGMNAYFGVLAVGNVKPGETLLVSGAAGAIGSTAAQIGRIIGARVIGLAGSERKCRLLVDELRIDGALNYRSPHFSDELSELCPQGPDVYFDNVGGDVSQTVMWQMRRPARIVECGQISTMDTTGWTVDMFPVHMNELVWASVVASRHAEFWPGAIAQIGAWVRSGELTPLQTVLQGIEAVPEALAGLYTGSNIGKTLVRVTAEEG